MPPTALPSVDLRFRIRVDVEPELEFLGPTARGLLGHGLRQVACSHGSKADARCPAGAACAYARLFEGATPRSALAPGPDGLTPPAPMVLEFDAPFGGPSTAEDGTIGFCVRVFGSAIDDAHHVIEAVAARQRFGFGAASRQFELVSMCRESFVQPEQPTRFGAGPLVLDFLTPLSLRHGQRADRSVDVHRMVDAARRRDWLMRVLYGHDDAAAELGPPSASCDAGFSMVAQTTRRWTMSRRSGRQSRSVPMEGLLGRAVLSGDWQLEAWLHSLERLHLGKYAIFGFGRVRVQKPRDNMFAWEPPCFGGPNGPSTRGFPNSAS
jgi:hypothetical protein